MSLLKCDVRVGAYDKLFVNAANIVSVYHGTVVPSHNSILATVPILCVKS